MHVPLTNSPSLFEVPPVDSAHELELDAEDSPYANWGEVLEHDMGRERDRHQGGLRRA